MLDPNLTVTLGAHRYAVNRRWGAPPSGVSLELLSAIGVDGQGRVHAVRRLDPPVLVFAADGTFVRTWGQGRVADPHGLHMAADGRVLIVDRDAHQVLAFDGEGGLQSALGERHVATFQAPFNHPTGAAVAPDGEIYVSDGYGNSCVHRFSADGRHLQSWGEPGAGPGEFTTPHAVWVDRQNRVLVLDRENNRVQVFDRDGAYLNEWPDLYHPMAIYEDADGFIYVTDQIPRLSMFAPDGTLVGRCRPVFNGAHGIGGDADGNLYMTEMSPPGITKLTRLG